MARSTTIAQPHAAASPVAVMPHERGGSYTTVEQLAAVESELARVREELERMQRLATVGRVAAGIAHEINNLLTPALGYAQLARQHPANADLRAKAYDRAVGGAERAAAVSRALLALTRSSCPAGEGGESTRGRDCRLQAAAEAAVDAASDALQASGAALTVDLPDVRVAMEDAALTQVFLNLLINAARAVSGPGAIRTGLTPRIDISGRVGPVEDGTAEQVAIIDISDNGPGIPPSLRLDLFKPLVRGEDALPVATDGGRAAGSTVAAAGHGLGLSICQDLVTAAHGEIVADTSETGGARFTLTLPMTSR